MNYRNSKDKGRPHEYDGQGNDPPLGHTHQLAWLSRAAAVYYARFEERRSFEVSAGAMKLVLWDLAYADGRPTSIADISHRTHLVVASVTLAIQDLERRGIITRIPRLDCELAFDVIYEKIPSPR